VAWSFSGGVVNAYIGVKRAYSEGPSGGSRAAAAAADGCREVV